MVFIMPSQNASDRPAKISSVVNAVSSAFVKPAICRFASNVATQQVHGTSSKQWFIAARVAQTFARNAMKVSTSALELAASARSMPTALREVNQMQY